MRLPLSLSPCVSDMRQCQRMSVSVRVAYYLAQALHSARLGSGTSSKRLSSANNRSIALAGSGGL